VEDSSVKWLSYVVVLYTSVTYVFGTELPRGITSESDRTRYTSRYAKCDPSNSYDTTALVLKLKQRVEDDPVAVKAMDLFLDCKYWLVVDYCEDHIHMMAEPNAHLFKEAMVLLASHLDLGNYRDRVVAIIGDPKSVTPDYFVQQDRKLLFDMFFYGAVESAKRGCGWMLPEIGAAICDELEILAETSKWAEHEQFRESNVRYEVYNWETYEDTLIPLATEVWPNLPDGTTVSYNF
jgi:hypothetical protein